jgi:hypothetical protein
MSAGTKFTLRVLGTFLALACVAVWLVFFSSLPGGMRPSYKAADYDARLTRVAKTAKVAIAAVQAFHREHSAYPGDTAALGPYLSSAPPTAKAPEICGWFYTRKANGSGYTLARKLGWDPCLLYECDGSRVRWVFSSGDGSPDKTIQLTP